MSQGVADRMLCEEKSAIEKSYGPWTAHNISLGDGVFTMKEEVIGDEVKLRRVVQIVADICSVPIRDLTVVDLACLEGMYALEFGQQGARVSGIEGRESNIEKARFAGRVLSLENVTFHQDDVRNLSVDKYGFFDVVLCLGILYHLDSPDVFRFLESVSSVCRRVAIIDTAISPCPEQSFAYGGKEYLGKIFREHDSGASSQEKQKNLWASLDNPKAVHLTKPSLFRLLYEAGFTSVYECHLPQEPEKPAERVTLVAIKGTAVLPMTCPQLPAQYARDIPEERGVASVRRSLRVVSRYVPAKMRRSVRELLFLSK